MEDFLKLEQFLTDEERTLKNTVRRFVDAEVIPHCVNAYEKALFPQSWISAVAQMGLLGMTLPETSFGSQAGYRAYGLVCYELERGDSGLRSFVSVQSSLCMYPIFAYGSAWQQQKFLPKMARGEWIGCFGLTEPDVGSDPASMKTHAEPVTGGWRLNGAKTWITNAPIADVAIVWAKTPEGIRGFLVEKHFAGFDRIAIENKASLRASSTGQLIFQDVFIPEENLLPGSDCGLRGPLSCLSQARYGIAWGALGAASACYDMALAYTSGRRQFAKPLAAFQLVQHSLAEMLTEITRALAFNYQLAALKERQQASPVMVSMAKMSACQVALKVARDARNLLGANGISLEYHVIRHMHNLESVFTYEGTDAIHHLVIGKHITGIDAFN